MYYSMALCVFDLDNTLGDFRIIDFFGMVYEPKCLLGYPQLSVDTIDKIKKEIDKYDETTKTQLQSLRDDFELAASVFNIYMIRPKLKEILSPLVKEYKKGNINGFIIYSNNANLYALEYAGRAIQRMFNEPNLFIKYLDRNSIDRDEFDSKDGEGYRTKTVATIKKLFPDIKPKILFMDDLVHDDFVKNNVSYVHVPAYTSNVGDDQLNNIWAEFEKVFNASDIKNTIFNLYHIKDYLQYKSLEDIKNAYLKYSKINEDDEFHKSNFQENITMIKNNISQYINTLTKKGGKRKTRRFKNSRQSARKRKFEIHDN